MPKKSFMERKITKAHHKNSHLQQRLMTSMSGGVDLDNRTIYLVGEVDNHMLHRFVTAFDVLDSSPGPIRIILSTPGGSEPDGYAIYDMLKLARNNVVIEGYGAVQSIGSLILQAGDLRLLSPECRVMVHNGSVEFGQALNTDTLVSIGKEIERNNKRYVDVLAHRSSLPVSKVRELVDEETYMSAAESIQYGFADGILIPEQKLAIQKKSRKPKKKKAKK